ncbi:hypothetical protein BN2475_320027 [Paraburkholderia ribeironis]|uniref:Uncharacterized protein n=1 Tax=Paraburkholderia ribeironis TaxID=1247936 RepID=A0A1N7S3A8_9BURK|nr:hypothetical protein BN2475_320027 [Paraburkholderia ribeironis]
MPPRGRIGLGFSNMDEMPNPVHGSYVFYKIEEWTPGLYVGLCIIIAPFTTAPAAVPKPSRHCRCDRVRATFSHLPYAPSRTEQTVRHHLSILAA